MESFTHAYDEKIRPLMDRIDQARSLLSSNDDGIKFPTVVVVGDQSSGKSTLLEALSLVELPKGSGIVTRCPLVLRLRKANERKVYRLEDNNKRSLLDETKLNILQYIEEETSKLAGKQKNVVHDPIELQVEDPQVRDLTVVDLPGIARNPIADQPKDIHKQTTDLIRQFIKQEGSVILCVFPANVDVATVESFTLAREVDPKGIRTIGVITKSDLAANHDALAQQLLMDRTDVLHLKLGFVAVRNRSTNEKLRLSEARKREKEFFHKHPVAALVGSHCLGIDALINRLADLYADRVQDTFPKMRDEVHRKLKEACEKLSKLPAGLETPSARLAKYHELADLYVENILRVRITSSNDGQRASMVNLLHSKFTKLENIVQTQKLQLFTNSYLAKVRVAMSACFGEQLPNFLPHPVLKGLICEKLDELWQATEVLINECFQMSFHLLSENDEKECNGDILLLKLLPAFRDLLQSYVNDQRQVVYGQLQELIRLEKQDPYTINHYYTSTIKKYKRRKIEGKPSEPNITNALPVVSEDDDDELMFKSISNNEETVQDMLLSIASYWNLLLKRFIDYTALSLRTGCVFDILPGIKKRLRQVPMEQTDFVDSVLMEDTFVRAERKQLQQTKARLEKVDAILGGSSANIFSKDTLRDSIGIRKSSFMTLDQLAEKQTCSIKTNCADASLPLATRSNN
ncbi:unnamed protein product [Rotaria magnacalcarata]|uniref:Uncharacterized protein n=1 Tax=Rotaria magnacalcarata TaxID=392030 RepID=A0A819KAF3_9BILA|nr:unnamed protein product [Rotaria magnacalcarata]CAF1669853.1 unnamed protein product [Rotaria magnacalcarata]CAF1928029.1 unnamed protein product [Rotaria magnacalcarata]CAF2112083.1 unnamed protein product [Rotaria magnacalcarata]CAF2174534.1 unnamed protein product [Rotaria magnacalcarata]